jgi:hypothetical protein
MTRRRTTSIAASRNMPKKLTDGLHNNDKRGIVRTAIERALQQMHSFHHLTGNFVAFKLTVPNAPLTEEHHSRPTTRQENHPTFTYPPIHEILIMKTTMTNYPKSPWPPQMPDIIFKNRLHIPTN